MITGYWANGDAVVPATAKLLAVLHPDVTCNNPMSKRERQLGRPWALSAALPFLFRLKGGL